MRETDVKMNGQRISYGHHVAQGQRPNIEDVVDARYVTTAGALELTVAMVADGIGGNKYGERAAELAVQTTFNEIINSPIDRPEEIPALLEYALKQANEAVFSESKGDRNKRGMGSTATIAVIHDNRLYVANVGDSRAYLLREGQAMQLTRDHTWAFEMVRQGRLSREEATGHPKAEELVRSIGYDAEVEVDLGIYLPANEEKTENGAGDSGSGPSDAVVAANGRKAQGMPLRINDRLVLCSDGLIKSRGSAGQFVEEAEMAQIVSRLVPEKAAVALVEKAESRQADDNVSAIVLEMPGSKRAFYVPQPVIIGVGALLALIAFLAIVPGLLAGREAVAENNENTPIAAAMVDAGPTPTWTPQVRDVADAVQLAVRMASSGARWETGEEGGSITAGTPLMFWNSPLKLTTRSESLIVDLPDGTMLQLNDNTEVEIRELAGTYGATRNYIILSTGMLVVQGAGQPLVVANPFDAQGESTQGVMGIAYSDDPFQFDVDCLKGLCAIRGEVQGERAMNEGEWSFVDGSGVPSDVQPARYNRYQWVREGIVPTVTATATATQTPTPTQTPTATTASSGNGSGPAPDTPTAEPVEPTRDEGGRDDGGQEQPPPAATQQPPPQATQQPPPATVPPPPAATPEPPDP